LIACKGGIVGGDRWTEHGNNKKKSPAEAELSNS
jgi:hypothetical protein